MEKINHNYLIKLAERLQEEYSKLYNFELTDQDNKGHPFYENYQSLLTLENKPCQFYFILTQKLIDPIEKIEEVKSYSEYLYRKFKHRLLNNSGLSFYGYKFELTIASHLLEKGINFKSPDPPDFEIDFNGEKHFIECKSSQFRPENPPKDKQRILAKIEGDVFDKMIKSERYLESHSALFIEITNLVYYSMVIHELIKKEDLSTVLENVIHRSKILSNYGAVMFLNLEVLYIDGKRFYVWKPYLFTSNKCSENLSFFLNKSLIKSFKKEKIEYPMFS